MVPSRLYLYFNIRTWVSRGVPTGTNPISCSLLLPALLRTLVWCSAHFSCLLTSAFPWWRQLTSLQHTRQRKLYSHCVLGETNGNSSSHCCLYLVPYFAAPPTLLDFTRLALGGEAAILHCLGVRNCTSCERIIIHAHGRTIICKLFVKDDNFVSSAKTIFVTIIV